MDLFGDVDVMGLWLFIFCFILLPLLMTLVLGFTIAGLLNLTGLFWLSFNLLFYVLMFGLCGVMFHR